MSESIKVICRFRGGQDVSDKNLILTKHFYDGLERE